MSDQVPIPAQLVSPSVNEIFSPRTGENEAVGKVPSYYSKMDKNLEDIHSFLQDDLTREQFMQFAEENLFEENVSFLVAARLFRNHHDNAQAEGRDIWTKFGPKGKQHVNITHKLSQTIESTLSDENTDIPVDTYIAMENAIARLLIADNDYISKYNLWLKDKKRIEEEQQRSVNNNINSSSSSITSQRKKKVSQARGKDSQKSSRVFTKPIMGSLTSSSGGSILGSLGGVNLLNDTSKGTKVLLLGLPDSGKSTFFNYCKLTYSEEHFSLLVKDFLPIIQGRCLAGIQLFSKQFEDHPLMYFYEDDQDAIKKGSVLNKEIVSSIEKIWKEVVKLDLLPINDISSGLEFITVCDKVCSGELTTKDILTTYYPTPSTDVVHTKLKRSLALWETVTAHPANQNTVFYLCFTKSDLLSKKVATDPISKYYDFEKSLNYENNPTIASSFAIEYFTRLFSLSFRGGNPDLLQVTYQNFTHTQPGQFSSFIHEIYLTGKTLISDDVNSPRNNNSKKNKRLDITGSNKKKSDEEDAARLAHEQKFKQAALGKSNPTVAESKELLLNLDFVTSDSSINLNLNFKPPTSQQSSSPSSFNEPGVYDIDQPTDTNGQPLSRRKKDTLTSSSPPSSTQSPSTSIPSSPNHSPSSSTSKLTTARPQSSSASTNNVKKLPPQPTIRTTSYNVNVDNHVGSNSAPNITSTKKELPTPTSKNDNTPTVTVTTSTTTNTTISGSSVTKNNSTPLVSSTKQPTSARGNKKEEKKLLFQKVEDDRCDYFNDVRGARFL